MRSRTLARVDNYHRAYVQGPGAEKHLRHVAGFFREIGTTGRVEMSPLRATREVASALDEAGFRFERTYPVFYGQPLDVPPAPLPPGIEIRESPEDEIARWVEVWMEGFDVAREMRSAAGRLRAAAVAIPTYRRYVATIAEEIVGVAGLYVAGTLAMPEPTAVLPSARGRGIHTAFIRRRLLDARLEGCDLAFVETEFASTSHRNQQRQGLGLAFNRLVFMDRAPVP
jgi:hypothetical protein